MPSPKPFIAAIVSGTDRLLFASALLALGLPGAASASSIDRAAFVKQLKPKLADIRTCYRRELRHLPGLKGAVDLRFTIVEGGQVEEPRVKTDAKDGFPKSFVACTEKAMLAWRFAQSPKGAIKISYPLRLKP